MERRGRILDGLDLTKPGLKIGPSYSPLVPKRDGHPVSIMDHLDQAGLRDKYRPHGTVDIEAIEPVDYVWSGQSYAELVGEAKFHWVIASHVIEHSPDLIAFLNEIAGILTPDGVLALAVPDKRFCFDHYRSPSDLARVIDTHRQAGKWPTPGAVAEHFLNAASVNGHIIWAPGVTQDPALIHTVEDARSALWDTVERRRYHDIHNWAFSPASFRLLMSDLYQLGLISLRETGPAVSGAGEFYIKLSPTGPGPGEDRLTLALAAREQPPLTAAPV